MPDLLNRDFTVGAPTRKYVGDITYLPLAAGANLYLATVIDCCSRRVPGWAIAEHMRTELVEDALTAAHGLRGSLASAIYHSDQGSVHLKGYRETLRGVGGYSVDGLLIEPGDINTGTDTFATQSATTNPGASDGASALFVNQHGTRAIGDTILILPDSAAATTTLNTTVSSIGTIVTGDSPQPSPVGTCGTVVSGSSPDGSKAMIVLLFTAGRAVVRMEFDSAPGDPIPPQVVTEVGKKQDIAIRTGLPG